MDTCGRMNTSAYATMQATLQSIRSILNTFTCQSTIRCWSLHHPSWICNRCRLRFGPTIIVGGAFAPWGWANVGFAWGRDDIIMDYAPWSRVWINRGYYVHP